MRESLECGMRRKNGSVSLYVYVYVYTRIYIYIYIYIHTHTRIKRENESCNCVDRDERMNRRAEREAREPRRKTEPPAN